ncbi:MAG: GTPase [Crocosphaera sp.]|nr:GTPase [Crocosphaera sp.]
MRIIFVYNANSGLINGALDIAHKILSPETYPCNLCNITHGVLREREKWKKFRELSTDELEFLHKDEFEKKYKEVKEYPTVLIRSKTNDLHEIISKYDFNQLKNVEELIKKLQEKIV